MILVECYAVVVRTEAIKNNFEGGYLAYLTTQPNKTHVSDGELDATYFMVWEDLLEYCHFLISCGLHMESDICLFHMVHGPLNKCSWISWERTQWFGKSDEKYTFARLNNSTIGTKVTPKWWTPEKSIQESDYSVPKELHLIGNKDGLCKYLNMKTGKIVYIGRT